MPFAKRSWKAFTLARPCPLQLPPMTTERTRWCDHCGQTVHNLSAGTREEAEALVAGPGVCVSLARRPDGEPQFDLAAVTTRVAAVASLSLLTACFTYGKPPAVWLAEEELAAGFVPAPFAADPALAAGTLVVSVVDPEGGVLPGARVVVMDGAGRMAREGLVADGEGRVTVEGLAAGHYHVFAGVGDQARSAECTLERRYGVRGQITVPIR